MGLRLRDALACRGRRHLVPLGCGQFLGFQVLASFGADRRGEEAVVTLLGAEDVSSAWAIAVVTFFAGVFVTLAFQRFHVREVRAILRAWIDDTARDAAGMRKTYDRHKGVLDGDPDEY